MSKLEPNIKEPTVIKLFKDALNLVSDRKMIDAIDPEILVSLIMRYKIGGYGKEFFSAYLNKRKKDIKPRSS